jgi:hypothetical protein
MSDVDYGLKYFLEDQFEIPLLKAANIVRFWTALAEEATAVTSNEKDKNKIPYINECVKKASF